MPRRGGGKGCEEGSAVARRSLPLRVRKTKRPAKDSAKEDHGREAISRRGGMPIWSSIDQMRDGSIKLN